MVHRRALQLLGRKEDAREAVQEVFIDVMSSLPSFNGRCSITTWLYQITTFHCIDMLRRRGRRERYATQQASEPAEQPAGPGVSDLVLLRQLLSEADEEQARAAVYVYLDGMSHEQAAVVLGVSKRTVGNLIERFLAWAQKRSAIRKN